MTAVPTYEVAFLPWVGLREPLSLGPVTLWPWASEAQARVKDEALREHLEQYFAAYVGPDDEPVRTITICCYGADDFRQLSPDELYEMWTAVDAVLFASVMPAVMGGVRSNNDSWPQTATESFQLVHQTFQIGSDQVAVRAGSILHGGHHLGKVHFQRPWGIHAAAGNPDERLVKAFGHVFGQGFPTEERDHLFRALEWFRLAHLSSADVSQFTKVVMMMTAFEVILKLPEAGKRGRFAEAVGYKRSERAADWAKAFYALRGKIVHGGPLKGEDLLYRDWITHLIVADLAFWECVQLWLYEHGCLPEEQESLRQLASTLPPDDEQVRDAHERRAKELFLLTTLRFGGTDDALGWKAEH